MECEDKQRVVKVSLSNTAGAMRWFDRATDSNERFNGAMGKKTGISCGLMGRRY